MSKDLVSIIVPTYDSAKYIEEALDSCLVQEYTNLELVISDDKSNDHTVELIRNWILKHEGFFVRVDFTVQEENLGVRDNTNFLIQQARGDYIKLLEGDDVLVGGAIKKQMAFIAENTSIRFLYSEVLVFHEKVCEGQIIDFIVESFKTGSVEMQYRHLLRGHYANGSSVFFHRQTLLDLGGYIGARNCADWPTILNLTRHGVRAYFFPEPVNYYRRHDSNISGGKGLPYLRLKYEMKKVRNEQLLKEDLSLWDRFYCKKDFLKAKKLAKIKMNYMERSYAYMLNKAYKVLYKSPWGKKNYMQKP